LRIYPRGQTDTQTHAHTETYASQYFATAPAGEVKIQELNIVKKDNVAQTTGDVVYE